MRDAHDILFNRSPVSGVVRQANSKPVSIKPVWRGEINLTGMHGTSLTSPEHLRLSHSAAVTLGLRRGSIDQGARLHCLNLFLTYADGCHASCSYCGRAQGDGAEDPSFYSGFDWPVFGSEEIISRARTHSEALQRVCVSMLVHPRAVSDTLFLVGRLTSELALPVSLLVKPANIGAVDMERFSEAGVDMVMVAVDMASGTLFDKHRGQGVGGPHSWDACWQILSDAALVFGKGRFGCHLIAGFGETEMEMVKTMDEVKRMGGRPHIFAIYPADESRPDHGKPSPAGSFRRIQLARYLIDYELAVAESMEHDGMGRITSFGLEGSRLDNLVKSGKPFMASGCPGNAGDCVCNRPVADGTPGDIRSFPSELQADEIQLVQKQLAIYRNIENVGKTQLS